MSSERQHFRILVTSLAAKVPLLTALRRSLAQAEIELYICGADSDPDCLGRNFVEQFWEMPKTAELTAEEVIRFCRRNHIEAILPTRDGELPFFSRHRDKIAQAGIFVLVSPLTGLEACHDKLAFHHALPDLSIPTETDSDCLTCTSFVVKERYGSGSRGILLNAQKVEAKKYAAQLENPVFQPWIDGREYSVDLYTTQTGQPLGVVARSRDLIVNGEAQVSTTVRNSKLEEICIKLAQKLRLTGHLAIQAIIDTQGRIHIIECNCRFGGASTLSVAAGLNSPLWFFCEAQQQNPLSYPFQRSQVELRQIRHASDWVTEPESC